jgi:hypothetical protein
MKRVVQFLLVVAMAGLAYWLWTVFFPSPEQVIRSRLNALARTVSFDSRGGLLSQALTAEKIADFFTTDADIEIDVSGYPKTSLQGRDEVQQAAMAARSRLTALKVGFVDMNVKLDPDGQGAKVDVTGNATVPGEKDISAQEFNFVLKKVDGKWQISHVETVKTLSLRSVDLRPEVVS